MGRIIDYDRDEALIRHLCADSNARKVAAELQGVAATVVYDGIVTDDELAFLTHWFNSHAAHAHVWPLDELRSMVERVLEDGRVDDDERLELLTFLSAFAASLDRSDPAADSIYDPSPRIRFEERSFSFTGKLMSGPRAAAVAEVEARGGLFHRKPLRATNYVVVGDLGSDCWNTSRYGTKIEAAVQYRKAGVDLLIVREYDFSRALLADGD